MHCISSFYSNFFWQNIHDFLCRSFFCKTRKNNTFKKCITPPCNTFTYLNKGSSINDVTQIWIIFDTFKKVQVNTPFCIWIWLYSVSLMFVTQLTWLNDSDQLLANACKYTWSGSLQPPPSSSHISLQRL
jgi:hypothetical protein